MTTQSEAATQVAAGRPAGRVALLASLLLLGAAFTHWGRRPR